MEQAGGHYWMLMKGKQQVVMNNRSSSSSASHFQDYHSWEERAFAEDAAHGALGGCMWPPRSYSCSFCKREFRSAQALGGHMNVHRRDRAKLRQSLSPLHHHQSFDPASNNSSSTIVSVASSSSPPTRVSAALSPSTWSSSGGVRFVRRQEYSTRTSGHDGHDDIGAHLSVGVKQASTGWPSSCAADDQSIMMGCKRPKLAVSSCFQAAEMIGFKPSSMEDLDLELRLGNDPPQVN